MLRSVGCKHPTSDDDGKHDFV